MNCPSCGKEVPEGSSFCLHCGEPTAAPATAQSTPILTVDRTLPDHPAAAEFTAADAERSAARMKSYTAAAVLVFFLYWLFYLPGLIVNYIYWKEAKEMEELAGQPLPGRGCLAAMLCFSVGIIVLGVLFGGFVLIAFLIGYFSV